MVHNLNIVYSVLDVHNRPFLQSRWAIGQYSRLNPVMVTNLFIKNVNMNITY